MTTATRFEQGKNCIVNTLPQIWAKLNNNFLNKLPPLVNYPRLTTSSNLRRCVHNSYHQATSNNYANPRQFYSSLKMAKATSDPATAPTSSHHQLCQSRFPSMTKTGQDNQATMEPFNQANHHYHRPDQCNLGPFSTSATSGRTSTFTREDGILLFTSMTESFMEDI